MLSTATVVFDLDGVIVKTNFVKHAAMLALFTDYPQHRAAISEYILSNGGLPRRTKLAHLLQHHIQVLPTESLLSQYLQRYALALNRELALAPLVEGVDMFISEWSGARYVCSSAPDEEVQEQIGRRALQRHFAAVYGGSLPKADALQSIAASHQGQSVIFFGDSLGDYQASRQSCVPFVGVVCERDNFDGAPVVKLKNFTNQAAVQDAMAEAVAQNAT